MLISACLCSRSCTRSRNDNTKRKTAHRHVRFRCRRHDRTQGSSAAHPCEDVIYLGDTARLPYGTKSPQTISRYAVQCAAELVRRGIKLLVVACNTASAVALAPLREAYPDIPVIGVVEPGARAACNATQNGTIAVIATESTIAGGAISTPFTPSLPRPALLVTPALSSSLLPKKAGSTAISPKPLPHGIFHPFSTRRQARETPSSPTPWSLAAPTSLFWLPPSATWSIPVLSSLIQRPPQQTPSTKNSFA